MKICSKCKIPKEYTDFYEKSNIHRCKECIKQERKTWKSRINAREYYKSLDKKTVLLTAKKSRLKQKYKMTLEDYNKLFSDQKECCAICKKHQSILNRELEVDHCHKTGKIRGLLCRNCNHGIGKFFDNKETIKNLLSYIEKSGSGEVRTPIADGDAFTER